MTKPTEVAPAPKAPTIQDVATALGMHKSTVSLALSGKGNIAPTTRTLVRSTAERLGYQPHPLAQRLATGVNNSEVCLCSGGLDVGLTTEKILLIQKALSERSLEVPIYTLADQAAGRGQAAQIRHLCRQQPRAIICSAQMLDLDVYSELAAYQREGGIVVSYDLPIPLECDQVIFDREDNAYQAARYLIQQGHRRLGMGLSASHGATSEMTATQSLRLQGFRRALAEADLPARDEWIFEHTTYEIGGAQMAQRFLELPDRPTGLCIVNDYMALSFMVELMRAGVNVPEDVSIVGHDNQPVAVYCPVPLTSISQPVEQIARTVVELLAARLAESDEPSQKITLRGELIERQSVAAPPG